MTAVRPGPPGARAGETELAADVATGSVTGRAAVRRPGTAWDRQWALGRVLAAVDSRADRLFDRARGKPAADVAALALSNLSDYGFVWAVMAAAKARRPGPGRQRAVRALGMAGVASATVNAAIKRMVGRSRPEQGPPAVGGSALLPVRRPTSSSFPSGHTLAAFCTAVVLPERRRGVVASLALATAVAASRVHLRAHHASDVLGGALIGTTAGLAARRLVGPLRRPDR